MRFLSILAMTAVAFLFFYSTADAAGCPCQGGACQPAYTVSATMPIPAIPALPVRVAAVVVQKTTAVITRTVTQVACLATARGTCPVRRVVGWVAAHRPRLIRR